MDNLINDKIELLIMAATKNNDSFRVGVLRDIKNEFLSWQKAKGNSNKPLTQEVEIQILSQMVNTRRKNIAKMHEDIEKGHFTTKESLDNIAILENEENKQIEMIQEFLPKEPTEDDIKEAFEKVRSENNLELIKGNMGAFVKGIKALLPTANGKLVAQIVQSKLN